LSAFGAAFLLLSPSFYPRDFHTWLCSFVSQNWRAVPLISYKVIVDLIAATTTKTGLEVQCQLDTSTYPKGITILDAEMAALNITRHDFHGE
jgi:hypothetical protein